jgi:hypothetical protein
MIVQNTVDSDFKMKMKINKKNQIVTKNIQFTFK